MDEAGQRAVLIISKGSGATAGVAEKLIVTGGLRVETVADLDLFKVLFRDGFGHHIDRGARGFTRLIRKVGLAGAHILDHRTGKQIQRHGAAIGIRTGNPQAIERHGIVPVSQTAHDHELAIRHIHTGRFRQQIGGIAGTG